ncbi:MAG: hypothetical protein IJH76_03560 [Clostridia bacterium]|nr:hypothetical protein [Clostridia bacterium]
MPIITFWSNGKEQTGKTLSMSAISTYMAIEHNVKILVISTTSKEETLSNCFFKRNKNKINRDVFVRNQGITAIDIGMSGLVKMARSNKVTPEMIKNYTTAVFKDSLEILFSGTKNSNADVEQYYPEIIKASGQFYDYVFVDLDSTISPVTQKEILKISNVIVANINQKVSSVDDFIEEKKLNDALEPRKLLTLIGRYDKFSRYSAKNIARYMKDRKMPITIPYNTLFYDSAEDAQVPDMFLNYARTKTIDKDDKNYIFLQEVKRAEEAILYKIQEVQMNY